MIDLPGKMSEIDDNTKEYLKHVISSFSPGIRYACAYGSGVFKQKGHKTVKDNMIDFIFVVNDAFSWHYQTLEKYGSHYSFLRRFGPRRISEIQKNYGAGVYFNTCVEFDGRMIKYGVIQLDTFAVDLLEWKDLYIAGRLQKPVYSLKGFEDITIPFKQNLRSAVYTSLLTLPESFELNDLFLKIAGLSYTGDFRMIVGEDKGKIGNIVYGNVGKFHELYQSILSECGDIHIQPSNKIVQDLDPSVQVNHILNLPSNLKRTLYKELNLPRNSDLEILKRKITELSANRKELNDIVLKGVSKIVQKSSSSQTLKNSFTAGFSKSLFYSAEKLRKMLRALK